MFLAQAAFEIADERFQVGIGGARCDDEKVGERRDAAEVEGDEVFGLFVVEDADAEPGECFRIQGIFSR